MYVWGSPFTLMFLYIKIWAQVSAIKECESAVIIHTSPPSLASFPSPRPIPSGHHRAPDWALSVLHSNFSLANSVFTLMLLSPVIPLSLLSHWDRKSSSSVSPFRPCKQVHQYHFYGRSQHNIVKI